MRYFYILMLYACIQTLQCDGAKADDPKINGILQEIRQTASADGPGRPAHALELLERLAVPRDVGPSEYMAIRWALTAQLTDVRMVDLGNRYIVLLGSSNMPISGEPNAVQVALLGPEGKIRDKIGFWVNDRYGGLEVETVDSTAGHDVKRFVVRFRPCYQLRMNSNPRFMLNYGENKYYHPLRAELPSGKIPLQDITVVEAIDGNLEVVYPRAVEARAGARTFKVKPQDAPAR